VLQKMYGESLAIHHRIINTDVTYRRLHRTGRRSLYRQQWAFK